MAFRHFHHPKRRRTSWNRFAHYTAEYGFEVWIVTLTVNHYRFIGYAAADTSRLGEMMRKVHGSVAKLVNDTLPIRHVPFWSEDWHHDYFDGCLRDELQLRRAYRDVLTQGQQVGLVKPGELYSGTDPIITLEESVARAHQLKAYLSSVPYKHLRGAPLRWG